MSGNNLMVTFETDDLFLEDVYDSAKLLANWVRQLEGTALGKWQPPLFAHTTAIEVLVNLARDVTAASGLVFDEVSHEDAE